jgi:hypothetical protein
MQTNHKFIIRLISIITLAVFVITQAVPGYTQADRFTTSHTSHLRPSQPSEAGAGGIEAEMAKAMGGKESNLISTIENRSPNRNMTDIKTAFRELQVSSTVVSDWEVVKELIRQLDINIAIQMLPTQMLSPPTESEINKVDHMRKLFRMLKRTPYLQDAIIEVAYWISVPEYPDGCTAVNSDHYNVLSSSTRHVLIKNPSFDKRLEEWSQAVNNFESISRERIAHLLEVVNFTSYPSHCAVFQPI